MELRIAHKIKDVKDRTDDIKIEENISFAEMHLSDLVLKGLNLAGFIYPSPIQLKAIPLGRCGLDLVVQAKSGTGKTCVFVVVALEMISVIAKTTQVLVIAPTREIAVQISQVFTTIGSAMSDLRAYNFIGGIDLAQDRAKLKCCHIVIGTPGRLNQLASLGILNLKNVRLLIIDEADKLLTGEFKNSVLTLVQTLPLNKQILALSATYPNEVTEFLDKFMRSPFHVRLSKDCPALIGINQFVRLIPNHSQPHQRHNLKMCSLICLLSTISFNQCLIFSNSQLRAESVCNQLKSQGWPATFLTGGLPQQERLKAFNDLCSYKCRILVSTDLSARGLDSEHVNLTINLDVPSDQATYLHRVGRAGRFGSKGGAISIVCEGEEFKAIKAIATLANVNIFIMPEDWSFGIDIPEGNNLEKIEYLSENECSTWLKKQLKEYKNNQSFINNEDLINKKKSLKINSKKFKNGYKINKNDVEIVDNRQMQDMKLIKISKENVSKFFYKYLENATNIQFSYKEIMNYGLKEGQLNEENIDKINLKELIHDEDIVKSSLGNFMNYLDEKLSKENEQCKNIDKKDLKIYLQRAIEGINCINNTSDDNVKSNGLINYINNSNNVKSDGVINSLNNTSDDNIKSNGLIDCVNNINDTIKSNGVINDLNNTSDIKNKSNGVVVSDCNKENHENIYLGAEPGKNNLSQEQHTTISNERLKNKQSKYCENTGYGAWHPVKKVIKAKTGVNSLTNNNLLVSDSFNSVRRKSSKKTSASSYSSYEESLNSTNYNPKFSNYSNSTDHLTPYYNDNSDGINYYIQSAVKFASMMEYTRCVGRMSAQVAKDCDKRYKMKKYTN